MKVDVLLDQDVLLQLSNNFSITSNLNILRTARYMCPSVRYPGTVRFPGFFCYISDTKLKGTFIVFYDELW